MKKIIFILLCIFSLTLSSYSSEINWGKNSAPICTKVGNVNAYVDTYTGEVVLCNTNSYAVSVTWKAYGYTEDGTQYTIGGSTTTVSGNYEEKRLKVSTSSKYVSYSVDISAMRCK